MVKDVERISERRCVDVGDVTRVKKWDVESVRFFILSVMTTKLFSLSFSLLSLIHAFERLLSLI